jgi:hypothetical protein
LDQLSWLGHIKKTFILFNFKFELDKKLDHEVLR